MFKTLVTGYRSVVMHLDVMQMWVAEQCARLHTSPRPVSHSRSSMAIIESPD
jgi:hypothetical protein